MSPRIIPQPLVCNPIGAPFVLGPDTAVAGPQTFCDDVRRYLGPATGFPFPPSDGRTQGVIRAHLGSEVAGINDLPTAPGAYSLRVTRDAVDLAARDDAGLFYGLQTLRQLLPLEIFRAKQVYSVPWEVAGVSIIDAPRFGWRGVMLDCARHFFPIDYLERFIELIALHKFNVFHWHFTDDQGWRPEIRRYPRLTEVGAWREQTLLGHLRDKPHRFDGIPHGGFYSQDQMRHLVAYAARRHVTIVPEIEMPGHSRAAIAAYPELGNTPEPWPVATAWGVEKHILNPEESTLQFYQGVLDEILEIFPSRFIHIGGDEAVKDEWKASPRAQARIRELGLRDEHDLQAYIIKRMDRYLTERGRRLVGWDEILEGELAPGATVMSWRGPEGGIAAARLGHDVVMCRQDRTYLDFYQTEEKTRTEPVAVHGCLPLETAYTYDPVPPELTPAEAAHILGGQAQLWTEYIPDVEHLHYMMYPRAMAIAEALWSPAERREYADFHRRAQHHMRLLHRLRVHGRPMD